MISFYGKSQELDLIINSLSGMLHASLDESDFIPHRANNDPRVWCLTPDGNWELSIELTDDSQKFKYCIKNKQAVINRLIYPEEEYALYTLLTYIKKITIL